MILLAAPPNPITNSTADHSLSPTATAVLFVIGFIIDYFAVFPAWLQTRLTFACVLVAVRQGFDDSPLDKWTVDNASNAIQQALNLAKGAYIAGASAQFLVGCGVGVLAIWSVGCLLPVKWSKKAGRIATAQFKETPLRKMTPQVWLMAVPLGLLADLPAGWIGWLTMGLLHVCSIVATPLPMLIFGAS